MPRPKKIVAQEGAPEPMEDPVATEEARRDMPEVIPQPNPVVDLKKFRLHSERQFGVPLECKEGLMVYTVPDSEHGRGLADSMHVTLLTPANARQFVGNWRICRTTQDGYLAYGRQLVGIIRKSDYAASLQEIADEGKRRMDAFIDTSSTTRQEYVAAKGETSFRQKGGTV